MIIVVGKNFKDDFKRVEKQLLELKREIYLNPKVLLYIILIIFNFIYKNTLRKITFNNILSKLYFIKIKLIYFNKPVFYVVGDSHVIEFNRKLPFVSVHLGAITAHNLIEEESTTNSKKNLFKTLKSVNKNKDYLIVSAGEIDARMHINKVFVENNRELTFYNIIKKTVSRYVKLMLQLRLQGYSVLVLGIPPATTQSNYFRIKHYPSKANRVIINKIFNEQLKNICRLNKIIYLNVYDYAVGNDGFILPEYQLDGIHLNSKVVDLVKQMLKKERLL